MGTAARRGVRRRIGASALTAAFVGGLLGGSPSAHAAAPLSPDGASAGSADEEKDTGESTPAVWPRPQQMQARGSFVPVGREVTLIADGNTDEPALDALRELLQDAGARSVREAPAGSAQARGAGGLVVRAGTRAAADALRAMHAPDRGDLPRGGYRLAVGRAQDGRSPGSGRYTVALEGTDGAGLFHAVQTLRGLLTERDGDKGFAGATVRDWPTASVRGVTEGFYGRPWSHRERLSQLDFLGRTKQNRYLYAPGDDPYRQAAHWRAPYPADRRAEFRELTARARANHVIPGWAVSPGQGLCFSSDEDRRDLLRKIDAMYALGFRAVQLQFEDVSYSEWHCGEDAENYGSGPGPAARAHAELANDVAAHLARRHPDSAPLSVMPTEFYQDGRTEYRTALAENLHEGIEVAWTGVGVVPRTITGSELAGARKAFRQHPLVTMDNYPVNDYARDRLFLGPYRGREPAVAAASAGVLVNAMEQPRASRIALFTAADFAWNPRGYRPSESWKAAIDDLAGDSRRARKALRILARNDASSVLGGEESAYLRPLLKNLWEAYDAHDGEALRRAGEDLTAAYRAMRTARNGVPDALRGEVLPWLEELALQGEAGERAVEMLLAQFRGNGAAAWSARLALQELRERADGSRVTVGSGVLEEFTGKALEASDRWLGAVTEDSGGLKVRGAAPEARTGSPAGAAADGDPSTAYRGARAPATGYFTSRIDRPGLGVAVPGSDPAVPGGLTVELPRQRQLEAVTVQTGPGSGTRGDVEVHVPGKGWRRIGGLAASGWTELGTGGLRADAVRLRWADGTRAPVVHEITPWYADTPRAALSLSRDEVSVPISGDATQISARIRTPRPEDVTGRVRVEAPEGFTVGTPRRTTVPRGSTATVPVRITADASVQPGTHRISLTFGGVSHTLTVQAFPSAGGPDLARGAEASSSADETDDFPASAVNDGKADTRWSSPAEDDAWVQLKLRQPERVGHVVLHWQDAYAKRYRIQVSPDGKRWHTAATVRDGRGGRESVRMDTPGNTRYVRVRGEERGTRFGYSLWAVEVYSVQEEKQSGHGRQQHG